MNRTILELTWILFLFLILGCSFSPKEKQAAFQLKTIHEHLSILKIETDSTQDEWELPYPVYQYQIGDIDENGVDDAIVGVIKMTRFDSSMGKRIFFFKNYHGLVRPLWMGSRLGQPIEDFRFIKKEEGARIRSIELEKNGKYLVAEYKWRKFGLEFTEYLDREISKSEAKKLLQQSF